MADEKKFKFTLMLGADSSEAANELTRFSSNLKDKPLVVPIDLGEISGKQTEDFSKQIKEQAAGLDEIITKTKILQNIDTGEKVEVAVAQTRKWVGANGEVFTTTEKILGALDNIDKKFVEIGDSTGVQKVTSQAQKLSKEYESANSKIQNMATQAEKFMSKSENMTGSSVEGAKKTAQALLDLTKQWDKAYGESNVKDVKRLQKEIEKLNKEFVIAEAGTRRGAGALRGWAENLTNAWKQTLSYTFSLGSMRVAQQAFNEALRFTIELNKEMVNIQILQAEGAQTPQQIDSLAQSFNKLAKELGATTLEVAQGSVEWLRQGKSIEETTELLRASTMLSKLGNTSAAEATEYLTSTLNSYKMEASEAISIVDKLVEVDNIAATSTKELAVALRYVSAVAADTGVSLEQLISYIGIISSTTRLNAESIGQALKTILTRMQDIQAGKIDEDGLGINNVEIALRRVNIELRESDTTFRDFGGVLEDIAEKWDTLNDIEQANISKSIAGVRQGNMFRVLMGHMNEAIELQAKQYDAAGLAASRYEIYMEGIEATQNKLKASMEGLYQDAIRDGLIKGFLDAGIKIVEFIDSIGGLEAVLWSLIAVVVILYSSKLPSLVSGLKNVILALKAVTAGTTTATEAIAAFGIASTVSTGGIILLVAALGGLAAALYYVSQEQERHLKALKEANDAYATSIHNVRSLKEEQDRVSDLWKEYETLSKKKKESFLTSDESNRLIEVQNRLHEILPEIAGSYDDNLNFLIDIKVTQEDILKIEKERLDIAIEQAKLDSQKAIRANMDVLLDNEKELNGLLEKQRVLYLQKEEDRKLAGLNVIGGGSPETIRAMQEQSDAYWDEQIKDVESKIREKNKAIAQSELDFKNFYRMLGVEEAEEWLAGLGSVDLTPTIQRWAEEVRNEITMSAGEGLSKLISEGYKDQAPSFFEKSIPSIEEFTNRLQNAETQLTTFDGILDKLRENDAIGEQVRLLEELGIEVENQNGQWIVTEESINNYKDSVISAISEGVILTEDMTRGVLDLSNSFNNVVDGVNLTQSQFSSFASSMGQAIWNLAQVSGDVLYDNQNNVLLSSQAITTAMMNHSIEYNQLLIQMTNATAIEIGKLAQFATNTLNFIGGFTPYTPVMPTFGGVGGGTGGGKPEKTPEQLQKEQWEEEIKEHEKEKKRWKKKLDDFKKYIKLQKESLKKKKEEADWNKKLSKSNKDLAQLQADIALLALDNSEEAIAKRLELEQEAAELQIKIDEDKEERKYQLQVDALDKAQDEYQKYIDAQIEGIDKVIEALRELIDSINDISVGGASGGGYPAMKASAEDTYLRILGLIQQANDITSIQKQQLSEIITKLHEQSVEAEHLIRIYENLKRAMAEVAINPNVYSDRAMGQNPRQTPGGVKLPGVISRHSGGLIESHHDGNFAGGLQSNEVFAKLLKGEYVATEGQMANFMKNILPKIASEIPTKSNLAGGISVSMPITVEGNLDKEVIPDLDKIANKVIKDINTSLKQRGFTRQTTITGYL